MLSWASQKELVRTLWQEAQVREALTGVLSPAQFERPDLGWIVKILFQGSQGDTPLTINEIRERLSGAAPNITAACESLLPELELAQTLDVSRAIESGRKFAAYQEALTLSGQLVTLARTGQWGEIRNRTEALLALSNSVAAAEGELVVTRVSEVVSERVTWLWQGFIPIGKVCTVEGNPGLGKSTIFLDLAARLTTGRESPYDGTVTEASDVIVLSAEDGAADTIRPRLEVAGADLDRVHLVSGVRERYGEGTDERGVALDRDVIRLETLIIKTRAKLVVIDPIVAMLGGADFHRDQDVRRILKSLAVVAERRKCAIVTIRHLNKDKSGDIIARGSGSIGFVAAVRVAMLVVKHPSSEEDRVLAVYKTNLSKPPQPAMYRFKGVEGTDVARIEWSGRSNQTAQELMSGGAKV